MLSDTDRWVEVRRRDVRERGVSASFEGAHRGETRNPCFGRAARLCPPDRLRFPVSAPLPRGFTLWARPPFPRWRRTGPWGNFPFPPLLPLTAGTFWLFASPQAFPRVPRRRTPFDKTRVLMLCRVGSDGFSALFQYKSLFAPPAVTPCFPKGVSLDLGQGGADFGFLSAGAGDRSASRWDGRAVGPGEVEHHYCW